MRSYAIALCLPLLACTTIQGLRATQVAASATCAAGAAADAAGEPVGGVIEVAACWLADYMARRIQRLESDQSESVSDADAALESAAIELGEALDRCSPDPSTDQETEVARAYSKCRSLAGSVAD